MSLTRRNIPLEIPLETILLIQILTLHSLLSLVLSPHLPTIDRYLRCPIYLALRRRHLQLLGRQLHPESTPFFRRPFRRHL